MIAFGAFMVSFTEGRWTLWVANGLLIGLLGKSAMIAPLVANGMKWFDRRRGLAVAIIASGTGPCRLYGPYFNIRMTYLAGGKHFYILRFLHYASCFH